MTETQSYIIDIINLVPPGSTLYIQAPSVDNSKILNLWSPSQFDYFKQIILTASNKIALQDIVLTEEVEGHFQKVEIKNNDQLLFEGYDGMEYGIISKNLRLTELFIEKYITGKMCIVSNKW